ncbi:MAG: HDOD domain-containing protein [Granulosicoccus sp.]
MVFKSDSKPTSSNVDENATIVLAAAGAVSPVNELNAVNRAAICRTASVVHVQRNDQIKPENSNRWLMFLVEGSLTLFNGKEEVGSVTARTSDALQPLFIDRSVYQTAKTNTVAKIVKFGKEQLDILLREQQKNAIHVIDVQVGELDNLVFDDIVTAMEGNKAHLASSGETATRVLSSVQRVSGIPELSEVIQSDPGLTAHLINAANRVESGSADSTNSIRGAISRLGVEATRRNIEDMLRSNAEEPANEVIENRFKRYLQRSSLSAAIVQVLARELPELKPEIASAVALTADIGELMVLTHVNRHADRFTEEQQLTRVIDNLRTVLSVWLLSNWDFPSEFIDAANTARDWYRNHSGEITYTDLVTASLLIIQSEMPDSVQSSIPGAENLLLARRLQQAGIDLKSPGEIVKAATSRIVSVQALLKAG